MWTTQTIQRLKGQRTIMVGRPRKSGKREPNGRVQRVAIKEAKLADAMFTRPTAVYVMEAGHLIKVGVSNDAKRRIKDMQSGNGQVVRLFWHRWYEQAHAEQIERVFHRKMKQQASHSVGEWYYMFPDLAAEIIGTIADHLGFISVADPTTQHEEGAELARFYKPSRIRHMAD